MLTSIPRDSSRQRVAVLLLASLILNLLPALPASAATRRVRAQAGTGPFVRVLNLPVNDIVYEKQSKKLFASVSSRVGAGGNSVTEIDPATGALGASVFVGSEPNKLAVSDDGQTVYVGLDGAAAVRRVDMATHTASTRFALGAEQFTGSTYLAGDLAVVPGNPNALAVARTRPFASPAGGGVVVFDDGVQRPNIASPFGSGPTSIDFGANASTLYGNGIQKMTVDSSGATYVGNSTPSIGGDIQFENGLVYSDRGQVYNPTTDALVGTFANAGSGPFVVDSTVGRAYHIVNAITHNSDPVILRAYDINTFQPVGEISIGGVIGTPTSLVRWGSNGLAFRTNGDQLFLIQTALVPSNDSVPEPTPTPSATPTPTPVPVEASVRHVRLITKDLAYVPSSQTIYASMPSVAGPSGNSVVSLDPATGTVGTPVNIGSEPNKLALADDGHTLYVGLNGAAAVRRFDIATQTPGLQFPLGTSPANPTSDGFFFAADLAVMPGSPNTVAVSRTTGTFNPTTSLSVYDDGVKRPNDSNGTGTDIEFPSPTRIYSTPFTIGASIQRNTVSASGVSFENAVGSGKGGSIKYAGGLIYTTNGSVIDPETGEVKGTFVLGDPGSTFPIMTVDVALGKAYFLMPSLLRVRVFDINTFLPLGDIPVQYKSEQVEGVQFFEITSLLRWGTNGLAFRTNSHVNIVQSALIGPGSFPAPTPTPSATPTPSPTPQLPTFVRQVELPVRDVVYNPSTQKLYASVSGTAGAPRGDSITPVDPATGALGTSVSTGAKTEPDKLALSDDNQVLWLGYNGINTSQIGPGAIRRFDIATQTLGPDISLGTNQSFGSPMYAYDIAVAPGNANLIAVARYSAGSPPQQGVAIFDNGVQRQKTTPGHTEGSISVAFSSSPSTLYGGSTETGLKTIAVDSTGATVTNTAPYKFGPGIEFRNGLLYSGEGQVLNPATNTLLGEFNTSVGYRAMVIEPALNRAFFATADTFNSGPITITAYDLTTFVPVGRVTIPFTGFPSRLVRWGTNGLAVRAVTNTFSGIDSRLYIIQTALVSAAAPIPTGIQLSSSALTVTEGSSSVTFNVTRTGDLSVPSTVDYATADGTASERSDYTTALGTLRFAPGESSKTIRVLLTNDAYQESDETFSLTLSGATGAEITSPASATVTIQDNDFDPEGNPIDDTSFFVRQHYRDFLNRTADTSGFNFWFNEIEQCGENQQCREVKRVNVSAAFFKSIEFQETGYLVYRLHQASFATGETLGMRPFLKDTQEIGQGFIVGAQGWEAQLEANKRDFVSRFVARPEFTAAYPASLTAAQFVDALNANTKDPAQPGSGGSLTQAERDQLVADLAAGTKTRAEVLRAVAENTVFSRRHLNRAFVYMQYIGYLRRNPNASPNTDFSGYNFWLGKLEQFNGNYIAAEMIKAFITSDEYRKRFAP